MAFESVKQAGPIWEPKQTGSQKQQNLTELNPNENSYVEGYLMGSETGVGKDNNSTVHKIKVSKVGDKNHIQGENDGTGIVGVWGTGVLDDLIAKVAPGSMIRIVWKGKEKSKSSGRDYHTWDVLVDPEVAPIEVGPRFASDSTPEPVAETAAPAQAEAPVEQTAAAAPAGADDDDDDLPF